MKTNKSLLKRVRITKNGKILARHSGQNHFNAKESRSTQMNNKRPRVIKLTNKNRGRYLSGAKSK